MGFSIRRGTRDDIATIVRFNCALARESESMDLDPVTVQAGVLAVMEDASKGFYLVAEAPAVPAESDPIAEMMLGDATFSAGGGNGPSRSQDQVTAGQLLVTYEWSDWRCGDFWWIQSVWVEKDFRRRGIFKAMLERVIEDAGKRVDVSGLRLYTTPGNRSAQAAYARLGMKSGRYVVFEAESKGRPR